MDFMKVVDQAVREIKREVNLKVLKVPEIEQKVLDATDNEPWGPHGTALAEIAQATKKFTECQMVVNVLWTRLGETAKDWRYVYKALAVIEYLIANGSERALDEIIQHTYHISSLTAFEYVEPNGKDMGINVRKKAENIVALLNDNDKIEEARSKAAVTRDKYVGLSSRGITYKSGTAAYTGGNFQSSDRCGGFSGRYDSDSYRNIYEDMYQEDSFEKYVPESQRGGSGERNTFCPSRRDREFPSSASSKPSSQNELNVPYETAIVPANSPIDDDDDFDPRGTTPSKPAAPQEVDLFGESLIGDLRESTTASSPRGSVNNKSSDVDLFGDADFVSASHQLEVGGNSQTQPNIDLFATESAASARVSTMVDFFASSNPAMLLETNSDDTGRSKLNSGDSFALAPSNNYNGPDLFGAFTSLPGQSSLQQAQNPLNNSTTNDMRGKYLPEHKAPLRDGPFQVMQNPVNSNAMIELSRKSSQEYKPPAKEDTFQVKSGIWADSLSRGLIDLNITAPAKVNLAEIGIIGGFSDGSEQKPKAPPTSYFMGTSPGMGSTFSRSSSVNSTGSSGDAYFSRLSSSQCQFGGFQK